MSAAPGAAAFVLIPAMAAVVGSGFTLAKTRKGRLLQAKKHRMPCIAANGFIVLFPAAVSLDRWSSNGTFDTTFYLMGIGLIGVRPADLRSRQYRDLVS